MGHDRLQIVVARPPAELCTDAVGPRHEVGRIAGAARLLADGQGAAADLFHHAQHFANRVAMAVADVQRHRLAVGAQIIEGVQMRRCQVLDVQIVAHPRTVRSRIVAAEHSHVGTLAHHGLAGHLGQQGRPHGRLPDPALRMGTRHIEVPQRHITQRIHRGDIAQHPLAHELRRAVRIDRAGRRFLVGVALIRHAVNRCRGRKDEIPDLVLDAGLQQSARGTGVVAVVLERLRHRLRHDGVGRKVHDRVHPVIHQQPRHQCLVPDIADDEFARGHRLPETTAEVIEDDHLFGGLAQLPHHVAADVAGTAGD